MRALALAAVLLAGVSGAAAAAAQDTDPVLWPEEQRAFFQDGPGLLLSDEQRSAFLAMDEAARGAFVRELLGRDPVPGTPDNELLLGIERRRRLATQTFPSPLDVRAQLLFLRGEPAERRIIDCAAGFRPLEIWVYGTPPEPLRPLVVYKPDTSEPFRIWLPIDAKRALYNPGMIGLMEDAARMSRGRGAPRRLDAQICPDARLVDRATGIAGLGGPESGLPEEDGEVVARITLDSTLDDLPEGRKDPGKPVAFRWVAPDDRARVLERPKDLAAWAREASLTKLPEEPRELELGSVELDFPRRQGQRMAVRTLIPVPGGALQVTTEKSKPAVHLTVTAVVEQGGQVFEDLRVRYRLPEPKQGEVVALLLERQLRPDLPFLLRLKVRDDVSGAETRIARGFLVPSQPVVRLGAAARTAALGQIIVPEGGVGKNSIVLPPPPDQVVLNVWRADPLVNGERIVKVVFLVDGQSQLSRTRPPYSAEVRLASFPKEQTVRVEGYDENGELVAADEVVINRARGTFRVTLTEPKAGSKLAGKVRARAEVVVPEERRVESVDLKVNDVVVATLTAPPWEAQIEVPAREEIVYVSAVAKLDDGSQAEDTQFLRAPANLEQVDVHLVELYTAVTDGAGNLVQDLQAADFEVTEGGTAQALSKFELVKNLPLNVGLVLDTSTSMASSLAEAQRAASEFLTKVVTPRDRCFALGFGSRPYLLMPPTDDAEAVAQAVEGVRAVGATALHDALVTALYYFRAGQGQRALVLLSDGDDTASHTTYERALEFAQRSGVTVYSVGLGLSALDFEARGKLTQLAETSGGRAFFISRAEELEAVYGRIEEELRSRYLLAYQTERAEEGGFRPVDVKVKKRGLKARTARGYYP
ncbi:MAG TPA: VWA domain-containing protein [Thermoanaerobaculia bacterium]|nr:VWA domain-containing protein [Thermoanaerobaculia bacterium]